MWELPSPRPARWVLRYRGEVQGCRPVFRGEVLARNAVGENCKSIRDRFFVEVFCWRYVNAVWNWGRKFKVDVISVNHDFTLRKKKERKKINVWYIGLFVMYIGWLTSVIFWVKSDSGIYVSDVWYTLLHCCIVYQELKLVSILTVYIRTTESKPLVWHNGSIKVSCRF